MRHGPVQSVAIHEDFFGRKFVPFAFRSWNEKTQHHHQLHRITCSFGKYSPAGMAPRRQRRRLQSTWFGQSVHPEINETAKALDFRVRLISSNGPRPIQNSKYPNSNKTRRTCMHQNVAGLKGLKMFSLHGLPWAKSDLRLVWFLAQIKGISSLWVPLFVARYDFRSSIVKPGTTGLPTYETVYIRSLGSIWPWFWLRWRLRGKFDSVFIWHGIDVALT